MDKKAEHEQIFRDLEKIANFLPAPMYWLDTNSVTLYANEIALKLTGGINAKDKIIGKEHTSFYPKDVADTLVENNKKVLECGEAVEFEEKIADITTGEPKYFTAIRAPIRDSEGDIIGIIGTSIDITAQKEAEKLRIANDKLKFENQRLEFESQNQKISAELDAYKKFKQIADQMAHDLGSPLMALSVLENNCVELMESKRSMLRESISRIRDIAGSLLSQYRPIENNVSDKDNSNELLVYAILEQIIMDKQYEYQNLPIKFICNYSGDSKLSFIKADVVAFKRMLSNLINNSVEAMEDKSGVIALNLDSNNQEVKISVIDDGKGMSQDIIDKINNAIAVTSGKANGHGIGFSQIRDTLKQNQGKLIVESEQGFGTTMIIIFSRIRAPEWLAEEITINSNDIIIVLDDDNSIHKAWDVRFGELLKSNSNLRLMHFQEAVQVLNCIANLNDEEKQKVILLTDYELLRQNLNGLDVIEKTKISRSILVTSHYSNLKIRQRASQYNVRILPKILASEIAISVYKQQF